MVNINHNKWCIQFCKEDKNPQCRCRCHASNETSTTSTSPIPEDRRLAEDIDSSLATTETGGCEKVFRAYQPSSESNTKT